MNTFANTLFSSMLGWVRDIISGLFRMSANGSAGSFLHWVTDNWLPLVAAIVTVGIVLDLLVWFVRWRPHYVWLSNFRALHGGKRRKGNSAKDYDFDTGYGKGMGYEFFETESVPGMQDNPEAMPEEYEIQAYYEASGWSGIPDQKFNYAWTTAEPPTGPGMSAYYPVPEENVVIPGEISAGQTAANTRRRRSNQHKPRLFGTIGTVGKRLLSDNASEQIIDGLPPPIAKKDAFYDPVYPSREPLDSSRQPARTASVYGHPQSIHEQDGANGK